MPRLPPPLIASTNDEGESVVPEEVYILKSVSLFIDQDLSDLVKIKFDILVGSPCIFIRPADTSFTVGLVIPMPTLPPEVIRTFHYFH